MKAMVDSPDSILQIFEEAEAILRGHFILSSGKHSDTYLQCAKVLMDPKRADKVCAQLADKVRSEIGDNAFDIVVAPAMGGVVVGYEMARQLGVPGIFCERVSGKFTLRRGFDLSEGQRVLLVEDVVTTAKSSLETVECVESFGATVVAEASLVNRKSGGKKNLAERGIPLVSLIDIKVATYEEDQLPEALAAIPAVKPGSRALK